MGKYGVGIGDEFPIEDRAASGGGGDASGNPNDADYERRREEWRRAREAWREQRRQWRDEWRARWREHRRALREEMRARYGDNAHAYYGHDGWHGWNGYYRGNHRHLFHALAIVGLVAIAIAVFSHLYIVFGLAVLGALYFAYRRDSDYFDFMGPAAPHPSQGPAPTSASPPPSAAQPPATPPAETPQA